MGRKVSAGIVVAVGMLLLSAFATSLGAPMARGNLGSDTDWSDPILIDTAKEGSTYPSLVMDARGYAFAVWVKNTLPGCYGFDMACGGQILAARFRPFSGWDRPVPIGEWPTFPSPEAFSGSSWPTVAMGLGGDAVAAWWSNYSLRADFFLPDYGWGRAASLPRGPGGLNATRINGPPSIVVDRTGGAVVLWDEWSGTQWNVWTAYVAPSSGWREPSVLATNASLSRLAIDDARGLAVAVWEQPHAIGASWLVPGQGWSTPTLLQGPSVNGWVGNLQVGLSGNGTAILTWVSVDTNATTWGASLTSTGVWGEPRAAGADVGVFYSGSIAVGSTGSLTGVFCTLTGYGDCVNVWSVRFLPDTGWAAANPVREFVDRSTFMYGLALGTDMWGRATFAWSEFNLSSFTSSIWTRKLGADGAWEDRVQVSASAGAAVGSALAVAPSGSALLAWTLFEANRTGVYSSFLGFMPSTDSTPPVLTLTKPWQGMSVSVPSVTVEGWTEPGAALVVNGILVSVSPNGSFRVMVALSEGSNVIQATATDAAGNAATASVHVLYVSPVPSLDQRFQDLNRTLAEAVQNLSAARFEAQLLYALQVLFVALTAFFVVMYWRARQGPRKPTRDDRDPHAEASVEDRSGRTRGNPSTDVELPNPPVLVPDRMWPEVSEESPVYLSAKERVVLHLFEYAKYAEAGEVPQPMTQEGIAEGAGFERRHFAQYVRPLVRDGLIEERMAHVEGALQKRKVYVLTPEGWRRALGVRTRVQSAVVTVRYGSEVRVSTIGELAASDRRTNSFLEVVRRSIENGAGER